MTNTATDETKVRNALALAKAEDREIDDATARVIASWYHNGGDGYAFVSTGSINGASRTWNDLTEDGKVYGYASAFEKECLNWLGTYLIHRFKETNGAPIHGWSGLWL